MYAAAAAAAASAGWKTGEPNIRRCALHTRKRNHQLEPRRAKGDDGNPHATAARRAPAHGTGLARDGSGRSSSSSSSSYSEGGGVEWSAVSERGRSRAAGAPLTRAPKRVVEFAASSSSSHSAVDLGNGGGDGGMR